MADLVSDAGDNPVNRLLIEAIRSRGLNEDGALLVAQITHWQDLAAAALNARIFPLVYRAVNSHMPPNPEAIAKKIAAGKCSKLKLEKCAVADTEVAKSIAD